jgi:tetratricopeptide (TPR) repeat protein
MKAELAGLWLALFAAAGWAGTPFEEGEKLYLENEPVKARALLEEALAAEPGNPKVYGYLGIVYRQLGDSERAIAILQRGLPLAGDLKRVFYANLGDVYSTRHDLVQAEKAYGEALALDPAYASAWLNRANARVGQKNFQGAIADYTMFLKVAPQSPKRPAVEEMIAALTAYAQKQDADERARKDREQALMDQVLKALQNASADAQNLSTKSDKILQEKEEEIDIKQ